MGATDYNVDLRHSQGAVFSFVDGHVATLTIPAGTTVANYMFAAGYLINLIVPRDIDWVPAANLQIDYPMPGSGSRIQCTKPANVGQCAQTVSGGTIPANADGWFSWRADTGTMQSTNLAVIIGFTTSTTITGYGNLREFMLYGNTVWYEPGNTSNGSSTVTPNQNTFCHYLKVSRKSGVISVAYDVRQAVEC